MALLVNLNRFQRVVMLPVKHSGNACKRHNFEMLNSIDETGWSKRSAEQLKNSMQFNSWP